MRGETMNPFGAPGTWAETGVDIFSFDDDVDNVLEEVYDEVTNSTSNDLSDLADYIEGLETRVKDISLLVSRLLANYGGVPAEGVSDIADAETGAFRVELIQLASTVVDFILAVDRWSGTNE